MDFLERHFPQLKQKKERERKRRFAIGVFFTLAGLMIVLTGAAIVVYSMRNQIPEGIPQEWGITFSKKYAKELGLDWRVAYLAALDELGARNIRIPAYWDEVEPDPPTPPSLRGGQRGGDEEAHRYDFGDLDWMLNEAERRNAQVLLVVGRRLPRWPECHDPAWLRHADERSIDKEIDTIDTNEALLNYIRTVVERYRAHPAVTRWQVENEPFLSVFGICPPPDPQLLAREISLVRSLDDRQIVVTDSGELSSWIELSHYGDILGVSLYRVVWNQWFGYFYWPLPASFYHKKAELTLYRAQDVIITEVQLEPWTDRPMAAVPLEEQLAHFDETHFRDTIAYARNTGLSEIYLWGAEWWYWARGQGHPEFWEIAKEGLSENVKIQSSNDK